MENLTQSSNVVPPRPYGSFARWTINERKAKGLNRNQLAHVSGVGRTTIVMMEEKLSDPTIVIAYQIVAGLGKTFADFEQFLKGIDHENDLKIV